LVTKAPIDFGGLADLASALRNPDAFVIGVIAIVALFVAWAGVNPTYCFGFGLAAIVIYALMSWLRMHYENQRRQAQIDAKYGAGRDELERITKALLEKEPRHD
jgi:hypothetical protein